MPTFRNGILAAVVAVVVCLCALAVAADIPVSQDMSINAAQAFTWRDGQSNVAQFDGPVHIALDDVEMSADSVICWIGASADPMDTTQQVEIALVGNASLQHGRAKRSGDRLFVTAAVRGSIRVVAGGRTSRNQSTVHVYQIAAEMRDESGMSTRTTEGRWRSPRPSPNVEQMQSGPVSEVPAQAIKEQVRIHADKLYSQRLPDGTLAAIIDKGLSVIIRRGSGSVTQLLADRGVVFSTIKQIEGSSSAGLSDIENAVDCVYLEGDVRVLFSANDVSRPDARLEADQVLYEVSTDRAVLTNAIMHTTDPSGRVPVVMRAQLMKQLSREDAISEYRLQQSVLTTSSFATPTYAIAAESTYVRQTSTDSWYGTRTTFSGKNATMDLWGASIGWLPYTAGTVSERGFPLRSLDIGSSSKFGFFSRSTWGLFESIGRVPPRDLDLSYSLDYLANRGPAAGIDGQYRGASVSETTRQPSSFDGDFRSYFIVDHGKDDLGGDRNDVTPPNDLRGRIFWEHQQFLPDDWQVQIRGGWISDPTFLEEYFDKEFRGIEPMDSSIYLKHQRDSEAISLLVQAQPNDFVTTQEYAQENFEIQRMPELAYQRLGESFADDTLTLYSADSLSRLQFDRSDSTFQDLGYPSFNSGSEPFSPGLPAEGYTGITSDYVNRGDFRQEVAMPITIDRFRVQPYVVGRYTAYDTSPDGSGVDRTLAGTGVRITTSFWRVDDTVASEFWDLHRMRHVIEPEVHLFTSAMSANPEDVYVFDPQVDAINDITAAQFAIRQKWQTKRGGPEGWHNVDWLSWNTDLDFYGNKPSDDFYRYPNSLAANAFFTGPDHTAVPFVPPTGFHGVFFPSAPETSIPRNSFNNDQAWRISDSTTFISDEQYNLDDSAFATGSAGLAVRRGDRVSYYIGDRYIHPLDSNIASFVIDYELSTRYLLGMAQSYDFGKNENVTSSFAVSRRFDRLVLSVRLIANDNTGNTGVSFNLRPTYAQDRTGAGEGQSLVR